MSKSGIPPEIGRFISRSFTKASAPVSNVAKQSFKARADFSLMSHVKSQDQDLISSNHGLRLFKSVLTPENVLVKDSHGNSSLMALLSNKSFSSTKKDIHSTFMGHILEEVGVRHVKNFVDIQNENGETALMIAVKSGDWKAAEGLVKQGANLYLVDRDGNNVLMLLAKNIDSDNSGCQCGDMIDLYVASSSLNNSNSKGETAMEIAINNKKYAFAKTLLGLGSELPEIDVESRNLYVKKFHPESLYENGSLDYRESCEALKYVFWKISLENEMSSGVRKTLFAACELIPGKDKWQKAKQLLEGFELRPLCNALEDLKKNTTYAMMAKREMESDKESLFEIMDEKIYRDGKSISDNQGLVSLGLNLQNILQLSKQWHRSKAKISTLRQANEEVWLPLFEGVAQVEVDDKLFNATCTTCVDQLKEEGLVMDHCVGEYSRGCLFGKSHVISIFNENDKRVSTLQLKVNEDGNEVNIMQHSGFKDSAVRDLTQKAARKLVSSINEQKIEVDFKKIEDGRAKRIGIKELETFEEMALEYFGYNPAKEGEMEQVLKTYLEVLCGPSEHERLMVGKRVKPVARALGEFILPMIEELQSVPDSEIENPQAQIVLDNSGNDQNQNR